MSVDNRCTAITKNGERCRRLSGAVTPQCYAHQVGRPKVEHGADRTERRCRYIDVHGKQCDTCSNEAKGDDTRCSAHRARGGGHTLCAEPGCGKWKRVNAMTKYCVAHAVRHACYKKACTETEAREKAAAARENLLQAKDEMIEALMTRLRVSEGEVGQQQQ